MIELLKVGSSPIFHGTENEDIGAEIMPGGPESFVPQLSVGAFSIYAKEQRG